MRKKYDDSQIYILTNRYCLLSDLVQWDLDQKIELDIGCGSGSFTSQLALFYPDRLVFGADIMLGRLRKLQRKETRLTIQNLINLRVESRFLISVMLADQSIDRLHLLCPDPWPKEKHRQHRLLTSDFASQIARVLKVGGVFHFATDDQSYFESAQEQMNGSGLFEINNSLISDIAHIQSDFEKKWLIEGKTVQHIAWQKK